MTIKAFFRFLSVAAVLAGPVSSAQAAAPAEETVRTPATHMWIMTGNALVYVPARSLEHCLMLARQAANINSSTGECYNDSRFLKKIRCTKSTKKGEGASCVQE